MVFDYMLSHFKVLTQKKSTEFYICLEQPRLMQGKNKRLNCYYKGNSSCHFKPVGIHLLL